ncbi:hypothetical protein [Corynebacterium provencense]
MIAHIIDFAEYKARRDGTCDDTDPKPPTTPAAVLPLTPRLVAA